MGMRGGHGWWPWGSPWRRRGARWGGGFGRTPPGHAAVMTVTDPDVPDPLNDPRTLQADPGAVAEGEDLASTEDDPTATGEDELAADQAEPDAGPDSTGP